MTAGLRVYNTSGVLTLDMTMSISQMQGSFVTGAANGSGAMADLPAGKTRLYIVVPLVDLNREKGKRPAVTVSGNTMTWAYSYSTSGWGFFSANCRIYYGYY